jgi:hypothetical protein
MMAAGAGGGGGEVYPALDYFFVPNGATSINKFTLSTGAILQTGTPGVGIENPNLLYDAIRDRLFLYTSSGANTLYELDVSDFNTTVDSWATVNADNCERVALGPDGKVWLPTDGAGGIDLIDVVNDSQVNTAFSASWSGGCKDVTVMPDGSAWLIPKLPSALASSKLALHDASGAFVSEVQLTETAPLWVVPYDADTLLVGYQSALVERRSASDGSLIDSVSISTVNAMGVNAAVASNGDIWMSGASSGTCLINDNASLGSRTQTAIESALDDAAVMIASDDSVYYIDSLDTLRSASYTGTTINQATVATCALGGSPWFWDPNMTDITRWTN